jgi:hypothetical protein
MKTKTIKKKLALKKEVITVLNNVSMNQIIGGGTGDNTHSGENIKTSQVSQLGH